MSKNPSTLHTPRRHQPPWLVLALACVMLVLAAAPALAQSSVPAPTGGGGGWTVTMDDQPLAAERPPLPASIDTLLVSARSLFQAMGAQMQADPRTGRVQVTRAGVTLVMREGDTSAEINGSRLKLPVAPRREGGTLMVPLPFVAQALGYGARWDYQAHALSLKTLSGGGPSQPATASTRAAYPSAPVSAQPTVQSPSSPSTPAMASLPATSTPAGTGSQGYPGLPSGMTIGYSGATPASVGYPGATTPSNTAAMPTTSGPAPMDAGIPTAVSLPSASSTPSLVRGPQPYPHVDTSAATPAYPSVGTGPISPSGGAEAIWKDNNGGFNPNRGVTQDQNPPMPSNSSIAGTMDPVVPSSPDGWFDPNRLEKDETPDMRPDAALTGLTLERLFVSMFSTYRVRYRLGNLGKAPVEKPVIIRLYVGSERMGGGMQAVQDVKVERLNPGEFRDFEWVGDSVKHPFLNNMVIRAKVVLIQEDGAPDSSTGNNSRTVVISY